MTNTKNTNADLDKDGGACYFYNHRFDFYILENNIFVINKNLGHLYVLYTNKCPRSFLFCYRKILIRLCRLS